MYFYQPSSNIFSKCFLNLFFFTISRNDLSDIISEEKLIEIYRFIKIFISDKHDECIY